VLRIKLAIIGAGVTGLTLGCILSKDHDVTIYEKEDHIGGLASSVSLGDDRVEKYYHHFFKGDKPLLSFCDWLGISDSITWNNSKMAFFMNGKIHNFTTPIDMMLFPPLNLIDKFRLGLLYAYLMVANKKKLDSKNVREAVEKICGKKVFNIMWKPLMKIKFGDREDISAAWFWGRLASRASSRSGIKQGEVLGYFNGGYDTLLDAMEKKISSNGGKIFLNCSNFNKPDFDKIIYTIPLPEMIKVEEFPKKYDDKLSRIEYRSSVCLIMKIKESLSDVYWLNMGDPDINIGGVIEHSNLVNKYSGRMVYLFRYSDDKTLIVTIDDFIKELKKVFPRFTESMVSDYVLSFDRYATPVYKTGYYDMIPDFNTPNENVYVVNTSQIYPEDRSVNNSIVLADKFIKEVASQW